MVYNLLAAQASDPTLAENSIKPTGKLSATSLGNIIHCLPCGCNVMYDRSAVLDGCDQYIDLVLTDLQAAMQHIKG